MQTAEANSVTIGARPPVSTSIIQLIRAMARRQARIDARTLAAANDNVRPQ